MLFDTTDSTQHYCVTNRSNLLEILSSGIAKPISGYTKYYSDLLQDVPGYVIAVKGPLGKDSQDVVSSEAGQFPVLMEVEPAVIHSIAETDGWAAYRAVPVSAVRRFWFRSEVELQEFLEREYENVPIEREKFEVAADLFSEDQGTHNALVQWAACLPKAKEIDAKISAANKLVGAYAVLAEAMPSDAVWAAWFADELNGLLPRNPIASVEGALRQKAKGLTEVELLTSYYALEFAKVPAHHGLDPDEVLKGVESQIPTRHALKRSGYRLVIDVIKSVLSGRCEVDDQAVAALTVPDRAALMALLRSDPERLLAWTGRRQALFEEATSLAAIFVGLANGYSSLVVSIRGSRERQDTMSLLLANLIGGEETVKRPQLEVITVPGQVTVASGGQPILQRSFTLRQELLHGDLTGDLQKRIALETDRKLGLGCTTTRLVFGRGDILLRSDFSGESLEISVPGHVAVYRDLDIDRFKNKLRESIIPAELEAELRKKFGAG